MADDIEPKGLSPIDAHLKLIDASGKLRLLKVLLPKLKARGHRVLLFSQVFLSLSQCLACIHKLLVRDRLGYNVRTQI